jgi:hypothetical protein
MAKAGAMHKAALKMYQCRSIICSVHAPHQTKPHPKQDYAQVEGSSGLIDHRPKASWLLASTQSHTSNTRRVSGTAMSPGTKTQLRFCVWSRTVSGFCKALIQAAKQTHKSGGRLPASLNFPGNTAAAPDKCQAALTPTPRMWSCSRWGTGRMANRRRCRKP